ncbi:neurogenic locus notch homolog protein 1-like isoform X4 [Ptychodera flava]|uniref:neurogenic locus notch homolog protein 1-like isoform X4 n=1 Tax=Ptychodera flava TaxID=63121 RepID=UPI003969F0EC
MKEILLVLSLLVSPSLTQSPGGCHMNPCFYGATCVDNTGGGYTCLCADGYTGTRCGEPVDAQGICVTNNPCQNGGQCYGFGDNYACVCQGGFTGRNCEISTTAGCSHEGTQYNHGSMRPQDCNQCYCNNGAWTCTEMACHTGNCEHGGVSYPPGSTRQEDCNTCTCMDGRWGCTEMACSVGCYHGTQEYDHGARRDQDCNICTCVNGEWQCTDNDCNTGSCSHEGQEYSQGMTRQEDCNTCTCWNGRWACTVMECVEEVCPPVFPGTFGTCVEMCSNCQDGEACCSNGCGHVCRETVRVGSSCQPDHPCQNGASCVIKGDEPNYQCNCVNGFTGQHCDQSPDTGSCSHEGQEYSQGMTRQEDCNTCTCWNGRWACTVMECVEEVCPPVFPGTFGTCVEMCSNCQDGEACCSNGCGHVCRETVRVGSSCQPDHPCQNGASCVIKGDEPNYQCNCVNGFTGQHCDQSPGTGCEYEGVFYGQEDIRDEGCNRCVCFQGSWLCTDFDCPDDPCSHSPCLNGGSCYRTAATQGLLYICDCASGFTGTNCDQPSGNLCPSYYRVCQNGGTCMLSADGNPTCHCSRGYTGYICDTPIEGSHCDPNPCMNGGSCTMPEIPGMTFACHCPYGYTGQFCQERVEQWTCGENNPCMNGGTCMQTAAEMTCMCSPGYVGERCEIRQDNNQCTYNYCMNGGTCMMSSNGMTSCHCNPNFTGNMCETPIDNNQCTYNHCMNGGTCMVSSNGMKVCHCNPNFTGTMCETRIDGSHCYPNPCMNGGNCTMSHTPGMTFTCHCARGYTGVLCDHRVDNTQCTYNHCMNGGTCMVSSNGMKVCHCNPNFTGTMCETPIDNTQCTYNHCMNGGTCMVSSNGMKVCHCNPNFTGTMCETRIEGSHCYPNPCMNGGNCTMSQTPGMTFTCHCARGYTGVLCDHRVEQLTCDENNPCMNGGTCMRATTGMNFCTCSPGYVGERCEIRQDNTQCTYNYCMNGGTCMMSSNGMKICHCNPNFTGTMCETRIDNNQCTYNHCMNGGTCMMSSNGMSVCHCNPNFTGTVCETPIGEKPGMCPPMSEPYDHYGGMTDPNRECPQVCTNDYECQGSDKCCSSHQCGMTCTRVEEIACQSRPCMNGGTCIASQYGGTYTCQCPNSYHGDNCQNFIGHYDCDDNNPCMNGGTCMRSATGMTFCMCSPGFTGNRCDIGQGNPCYPSPCRNGGSCQTSTVAGQTFHCTCPDGFTGQYCEGTVETHCYYNPCMNGGTCMMRQDQVNPVYCVCAPGFSGQYCQEHLEIACQSRPCMNGGTCIASQYDGTYTCQCPNSYHGDNCQNFIGHYDCDDNNPCMNGGTCMRSASGMTFCMCSPGFSGNRCDIGQGNPCDQRPCMNGGSCQMSTTAGQMFHCVCPGGYTGQYCEDTTGEGSCYPNRCQNGGSCVMLQGGSSHCNCGEGYFGSHCQYAIEGNMCDSNPCMNGGTCQSTVEPMGTHCICPHGFSGLRCEQSTETPCNYNPCMNGGTCIMQQDQVNSLYCVCAHGFSGQYCQEHLGNQCTYGRCMNGGTCMTSSSTGTTICVCSSGFTGEMCETRLGGKPGMCPPMSEPYDHYGGMTDPNRECPQMCTNDYECQGSDKCCSTQQCGMTCTRIEGENQCDSNPCMNGGSCMMPTHPNAVFYCICATGYTGPTCGEMIDSVCAENPCQNGGLCYDLMGLTYGCICQAGFGGKNCEIHKDDHECPDGTEMVTCTLDPCIVAKCQSNPSARCRPNFCGSCKAEFFSETGGRVQCEDPCNPNPCQNGGQCVNVNGASHVCYCPRGVYGTDCEQSLTCSNGQTPLPCAINPCELSVCPAKPDARCRVNACDRMGFTSCFAEFFDEQGRPVQCYAMQCPYNMLPSRCAANPCLLASCPAHPDARCVPNVCEHGECMAEYFDSYNRKVDCEEPVCGTPSTGQCQNGGTCRNGVCECMNGYVGRLCHERPDPDCGTSNTDQCLNGGICRNGVCECVTGFVGRLCHERLDDRQKQGICPFVQPIDCMGFGDDECHQDWSCSGDLKCCSNGCVKMCTYPMLEPDCGTELTGQCQNGGTCLNGACICTVYFEGRLCGDRKSCEAIGCLNGGVCRNGECDCPSGFTGWLCEESVAPEPDCGMGNADQCQNGGMCVYGRCVCEQGFVGRHCEESTFNPCQHGRPAVAYDGTELFCGRGPNTATCPDGHYCNIAPNDQYAVCCPEETPSCPDDMPLAECERNPCEFSTCEQHPEAECRANRCGGCHAVFYDEQDMMVECKDSCDYGGERYRHGDTTEPDDCNTCTCNNGMMACTLIFCGDTTSCNHSGIHFKQAEYRESACQKCVCNNNDWVCYTTNGCETDRELEEVSVSFKLTGDYDDIVGQEVEFKIELKESLSANFKIPVNSITNLQVSRGSIKVDFELRETSGSSDVDMETVVSNMENRIGDYTFVYDGTEYQADQTTAVFEKVYTEEPVPEKTDNKRVLIIVGVVAAVLFVLILIMFITCMVAGKCNDRRRRSREKDYHHSNGKHATPREIVHAFDNNGYTNGESPATISDKV